MFTYSNGMENIVVRKSTKESLPGKKISGNIKNVTHPKK